MSRDQVLDSEPPCRVVYRKVLGKLLLVGEGRQFRALGICIIVPGSSPSGVRATLASTDPGLLFSVSGLLSVPKQTPVDGVSSHYLLPIFLAAWSCWNSRIVAPPPSWSPTPTGVYNMSLASANFIRAGATPSSCSLVQTVYAARSNMAPQGACQTLPPARPDLLLWGPLAKP